MIRIGDRVAMVFLTGISLTTLVGAYYLRIEKQAIRDEERLEQETTPS